MNDPEAIADMADALLCYGVHVGFADKRAQAAAILVGDGVSLSDIELLGDHVKATTDSEASCANIMFRLIGEPAKRQAKIDDLRKQKDLRRKPVPGEALRQPQGPLPEQSAEDWTSERNCQMAVCRVDGDRRSEAEVAREFGVTVKVLAEMLERGRALREPRLATQPKAVSPAAFAKADKASEGRRETFRQRMAVDMAQAAAARKKHVIDTKRIAKCRLEILEMATATGRVDVAECLRDKAKMGALADLEYCGEILRDGPADHKQVQPYRVARSDEEQRLFRDTFRAWNQGAQKKPAKEGEA